MNPTCEIIVGDCLEELRKLPADSVHCVVTSPPYYGLRDYGMAGQIGLEQSLAEYLSKMVEVFREVRRVLRPDGTCWINMGDSYNGTGRRGANIAEDGSLSFRSGSEGMREAGFKAKDLMGVPWRLAFALQDDGWWLRQDIVWSKPNPMPESSRDRCTKSHEYIFLLTRSARYHFDQEAILEPCSAGTHARLAQSVQEQVGSLRANGGSREDRPLKAVGRGSGVGWGYVEGEKPRTRKHDPAAGNKNNESFDEAMAIMPTHRNKRSVWTIPTESFKGAHFATFPSALVRPCILAGCPQGGAVLDPFGGSGTTGMVALELGRSSILIELNPEYAEIARGRCNITPGLQLS